MRGASSPLKGLIRESELFMRKHAIVGSGTETRGLAPYNDETFDIWVLNEAPLTDWCKRWTASFQMHVPDKYSAPNIKVPQYWDWLQQSHGKPVYMQEADPRVPDSVRYPLEDALALTDTKLLTSTVSQALALAALQNYERVDIYGVQMSWTEYGYQAEAYRFWVGFLIGKLGKQNVHIHDKTQIFEGTLYGYDAVLVLDKSFFEERYKVLDAEWTSADKSLDNIKTAIERYIAKKEFKKVAELIEHYEDAAVFAGEKAGALAEAEKYSAYADGTDRNAFEFASAKAQTDGDLQRTSEDRMGGMVEYVWNAWAQTKGNPQAEVQLKDFIAKLGKAAYETGAQSGIMKENFDYIAKYDNLTKASG